MNLSDIEKASLTQKFSKALQDHNEAGIVNWSKFFETDTIALKAAKYLLIELAEATSNTLQHILAKDKGIAVSGYIDTIVKGNEARIISGEMFNKLKPFFDFRNSLIHRYRAIEDNLIENILKGRKDFYKFIEEIGKYLG